MNTSRFCRLSPGEEAAVLQQRRGEKRKIRLLQVREQERGLARSLCRNIQARKENEQRILEEQIRDVLAKENQRELRKLENVYNSRVRQMGKGHREAHRVTEERETQHQMRQLVDSEQRDRAETRHSLAMKELSLNQRHERLKMNEPLRNKKKAMEVEKERSRRVASRASSDDQPLILNFEAQKGQRIRFDEADSYASSYYHLPRSVVERDKVSNHCARDEARDVQEEEDELAKQTESAKIEQDEKAWLRHKHALARVRLERDRDEMMSQLEVLEKEDRARRQRTISGVPTNVFQPIHQRIEMVSEQQKDMEQTFERLLLRANREAEPLVSSMAGSLAQVDESHPSTSHSAARESPREEIESRSPSPIAGPADPVPPCTVVSSKQIQTEPQSVRLPCMRAEGLQQPSLSVTDTVSSMLSLTAESSREGGSDSREPQDTASKYLGQPLPSSYVPGDRPMQSGSKVSQHSPQISSLDPGQALRSASSNQTRRVLSAYKPPQGVPTTSKPPKQPVQKPPNESMHRLLGMVREQQAAWKERQAELGKITSKTAAVAGREPTTGSASGGHPRLQTARVKEYSTNGLVQGKTNSHQGRTAGTKEDASLSAYPIVLGDSGLDEQGSGVPEISYDTSITIGITTSHDGPTPLAHDDTLASQPLSTTQYHTTLDTSSDTRERSDSPDLVLRNQEKSASLPFGRRSPKSLSITPYHSLDNSSSSSVKSANDNRLYTDLQQPQLQPMRSSADNFAQQSREGYSIAENLSKDLSMISVAPSGASKTTGAVSFSSSVTNAMDFVNEGQEHEGSNRDKSGLSFYVPAPMGQYMKSEYFRPHVRSLVPPSLDVTSSTLAEEPVTDEYHRVVSSRDKSPVVHQPPITSSSPIRASPLSKYTAGQSQSTALWHPLHSFHSSTCSPATKGLNETAGEEQRAGRQKGEDWAGHPSNQLDALTLQHSQRVSESPFHSLRGSSPASLSDDDDDDDPQGHQSHDGALHGKGSVEHAEPSLPQTIIAGSVPSYSIATSTATNLPDYRGSFLPSQPSTVLPHPLETSSIASEEESEHHHTPRDTNDRLWSSLASPLARTRVPCSSPSGQLECSPLGSGSDNSTANDTCSSDQTEDEHDRTVLSSVFSGLEFPDIALSYPTIRMPVEVGWFESGMSNSSREPSLSTCLSNGGARDTIAVVKSPPVIEGAVDGSTQGPHDSCSSEEDEELTDVSRLSIVSDLIGREKERKETVLDESKGFECQQVQTREQPDSRRNEGPKSLQAAFLSKRADFVKQSEARMKNMRSSAQQRQQAVHTRTQRVKHEVSPKVPSKSPRSTTQSKAIKGVKFQDTPVFLSGASVCFPEYETITREREAIKKREMKDRNLKLYNRLDEVKQKKEEEERTKRYADNRKKAKDYHQRLRARSVKALSSKKKPKSLR